MFSFTSPRLLLYFAKAQVFAFQFEREFQNERNKNPNLIKLDFFLCFHLVDSSETLLMFFFIIFYLFLSSKIST